MGTSTLPVINFAALQWRGSLCQRWLEGVPAGDLDETIEEHMLLPKPSEWSRTYRVLVDPNVKNAQDEKDWQLQLWEGHVAPGILYIDTMYVDLVLD
ncbi:hypothetical protein N7493_001033 [Penicillium malachiteum]|uniref:Uncharacterized protein n=1 Tax=Penicillium malachiteum TaxID=1324776 RepID=A0AAD6N1E7_9EURO|nr:hypothetical protein N7493_001033 [Penicillium malachiteum]